MDLKWPFQYWKIILQHTPSWEPPLYVGLGGGCRWDMHFNMDIQVTLMSMCSSGLRPLALHLLQNYNSQCAGLQYMMGGAALPTAEKPQVGDHGRTMCLQSHFWQRTDKETRSPPGPINNSTCLVLSFSRLLYMTFSPNHMKNKQ